MKQNRKKRIVLGIGCLLAFVIWTILIQIIDVQPIGPRETEIGFASWNSWFHKLTGVHMAVYTITDWLGLIPVFVCILFGGTGCWQLVRRRSFLKVDRDLLYLGIYYVIVIMGYLIFEMIPINYRPILIGGRLEASYPSSTTLLVLSVMPTLMEQAERRVKSVMMKRIIKSFVLIFSAGMVIGRMISGVHWFTDIVGAGLLSAGLFSFYKASVVFDNTQNKLEVL